MKQVIDSNDIFKKYDFSSTISQDDVDYAIDDVRKIIESGNYWENSPKFQTKENIFAKQDPIWLKFRMSFLFSVFMYMGREVRVGNMQAWSFMTNNEGAEDRDVLWHHHQHKPAPPQLSGIFYLKIPEDVENRDYCGTEFAWNSPDDKDTFFVKPSDFHWLIYPSKYWHRPAPPQSNDYRFIIAADVEIQ